MTREILIAIAKQIVVDMAYVKNQTINSFAMVDHKIDLLAPAFGKSFKDYLEGKFFSRTWVNQGADKNDIQGQFPLLFGEQIVFDLHCIDADNVRLPFAFVVVDKLPCDTCEQIPSDQVLRNVGLMIRRFLKELLNYRLYTYTVTETEEIVSSWTTEGRINYLSSPAGGDVIDSGNSITWSKDLKGLIVDLDNIRVKRWGNYKNLRGYAVEISFDICDQDAAGTYFKYDKTTVEALAGTSCENC